DKALEIILDAALELTRMQRGFIMLFNEEENLVFKIGRNDAKEPLSLDDFQVSTTLIRNAVEKRDLIFFNNLKDGGSTSAQRLHILCGLCVPLFSSHVFTGTEQRRKMIGALYADSKQLLRFGPEEKEVTNSLALHAGLALENAALFELAVRDGLTRLYQRR